MSTLQRIACAVLLLSATAAALTLWPEPQSISSGSAVVVLDPTFNFFVEDSTSDTVTLRYAFLRYKSITFPHTFSNSSSATSSNCKLTGLVFGVTSNDESHPQLDTDESYSLQVPECGSGSSVATANAATVYGALRALETFSQMVQYDFDTDVYLIRELPITIKDSPRFPHRGLMIDTARHFQPLTSIRAMIDSLPFAKLNVLHWQYVFVSLTFLKCLTEF
jgi:hexosaminidase